MAWESVVSVASGDIDGPVSWATLIFFKLILFIGCAGFSSRLHWLFSSCSAQSSHYGGFSCCRTQVLGTQTSVVTTRGLSSCGSWAPEQAQQSWHMGLGALWHVGLFWISDQTCLLLWQADSWPLGHQGSHGQRRLIRELSTHFSGDTGLSYGKRLRNTRPAGALLGGRLRSAHQIGDAL